MYRIKQFYIEQFEQRKTIMCTQHPIEEPCKLDPPWEGPQVIPAQLHRVDNLIFRRLNQFSRANEVEQTTPMHGCRTADRGGERRTAAAAEQAAGSTEITIFSVKAPKKDLLN